MIIEAPCKICNHRHAHCHESCKLYKLYRKKMDKLIRERIKANQQASDAIAVKEKAIKKRQGWIH